MKHIAILGLLVLFFTTGCIYTEGDVKANKAFKLMTTKEKQIHDLVMEEWGENMLLHLRDGVRTRSMKPDEGAIPFCNLAEIVKTINNNQMIVKESWPTTKRQCRNNARFEGINPEWYNQITSATKSRRNLSYRAPNSYSSGADPETGEVNYVELITIEEYDELKFEVRGCPEAITLLRKIVNEGRPLTIMDRDAIMERALYCKAASLSEYLED